MSATSSFPINSFQIGSGPAAAYFQSNAQSIPNSVQTLVNFQIKEFDTDSAFNINTGIFQPKVAGIYQINAVVAGGFTTQVLLSIYKNGTNHKRGCEAASALNSAIVSSLIVLNGNDYVEFKMFHTTGVAVNTNAGSSTTYFNAAWIRGL